MASAQNLTLTTAQQGCVAATLKTLSAEQIRLGTQLVSARAVQQIEWTEPNVSIEAVILDDLMFRSVVYFVDDGSLLLGCTCDPHDFESCEHSAALLIELKGYAGSRPPSAAVSKPSDDQDSPNSLVALFAKKLGQELPRPARNFLLTAERWWTQRTQFVEKTQLNALCGASDYWGYGRVQIFPAGLPPANALEYLSWLSNACGQVKLQLPDPLPKLIDPALQVTLKARWARLKAVDEWKRRLADWKSQEIAAPTLLPELRLLLLDGEALVQAKQPGATSFGKATQKLLKELGGRSHYSHSTKQLSAGTAIILRATLDDYGGIRGSSIPPLSSALNLCLGQLLSQPSLFEAHVVGQDEEPLQLLNEMLEWQLTPPAQADADYTLRLVTPNGVSPPSPVAIVAGSPLRYVTTRAIYQLPYWPFEDDAVTWPVAIPAEALETQEGVSAMEKLAVPVPEKLVDRVVKVKAEVTVTCRVKSHLDSKSDHFQLSAAAHYDGKQAPQDWTGHAWQTIHQRNPANNLPDGKLVQIDQSLLPPTAAWLRQMTLTTAHRTVEHLWLEQRITGKDWPDRFNEWLECRPKGVNVMLDAELASLRDGKVAGQFSLDVSPSKSGMDWFDLTVELKVSDTTLTQPEIDLLLKAKGRWVKLGDKGWRKLQFEFTEEQQREFADLGLAVNDFTGQKQRLHALQLDGLTKKSGLLLADDQVRQIKRRVEEIQTRVTPDLPTSISATLRPYQLTGFHFLAYLTTNRFGGVLADDMGLGKTLQTLAWIAWLREVEKLTEPILVICPKSVQDNWRAEVARFCPSLRCEVWSRASAGKTGLRGDTDLLVIHYPQLRIHEELLRDVHWGAVILDEAQAIKNPTSQSAKAACGLNARYRLALTGTPIENRLLDLWSIFAFAMPGALGTRAAFTRDFDGKEDPLARRRLAARTRPFLLRRTKNEVAKDLPDRVEEDLVIEMEGTQAALYQAELKRARAQLLKAETSKQLDKLRFNILTSLLRLRQICCHPRLLGLEEATAPTGKSTKKKTAPSSVESAKVSALMELLEQLTEEGQKVLVFSQFVEMLAIIEQEISAREWHSFKLTGQTEDRGAMVQAFQAHEGPSTFLISLKAGGFGLNLTAASYVVLFDPWWNPAVEAQAIDRTHRIGQKQTVFAYRLLIKDSIEEKIRLLQKQKGNLANDILGEENFAQALTLNDFQFLLGEG